MLRSLIFSTTTVALFLFAQMVTVVGHATSHALVINEIGAYETDGYEWVEVYNRDAASVDITNWKFVDDIDASDPDGVAHSLTPVVGDAILDPGEYAIIAEDATKFKEKYPAVTASVFDSSWGILKESGETVGIKNASGTMVEQFTYIAIVNYSLERKNPALDDYTNFNWHEHASGNTAGAQNSAAEGAAPAPQPAATPTSTPQTPTEEVHAAPAAPSTPAFPAYLPHSVVINEFVVDPPDGDTEWVELYNTTDKAIDLIGWRLEEGTGAKTELQGAVGPFGFAVVSNPKGALNNTGDVITVFDGAGTRIDQIVYGKWNDGNFLDNAPTAKDPLAVARALDGGRTGNDARDFAVTLTPTKGASNRVTEESKNAIESPGAGQSPPTNAPPPTAAPLSAEINLVISELLPNPKGKDDTGEFIEIENRGEAPVTLTGWKLQDAHKVTHIIGGKEKTSVIVPAHGFIALFRGTTKLILNNNEQEVVRLLDPFDRIVAEVPYEGPVEEGMSYARTDDGSFVWSTTPTPSKENIVTSPNRKPEVTLEAPKESVVGEEVLLDASDAFDPDGDTLAFSWSFGDRSKRLDLSPEALMAKHIFKKAGLFTVVLSVSDGVHTVKVPHPIVVVPDENLDTEAAETLYDDAPKKTKKTSARRVSRSRAQRPLEVISLDRIHETEIGDRVQTEGIVAVAPGVFSSQYLYIVGSRGAQVYSFKRAFPALAIGDRVRVRGEISKPGGEVRIKTKTAGDIKILSSGNALTPEETAIGDLDEERVGSLVRLEGEVVEVKKNGFALDDEGNEIVVTIKEMTGIAARPAKIGDVVEVAGIVGQTRTGLRLLPRAPADLEVVGHIDDSTLAAEGTPPSTADDFTRTYMPATAAGVTSILLSVLWKQRGLIARSIAFGGLVELMRRRKDKHNDKV